MTRPLVTPLLLTRAWELELDPPNHEDILSGMSPFLLLAWSPQLMSAIQRANREWDLIMSATVAPDLGVYRQLLAPSGMFPLRTSLAFLASLECVMVW